MARYAIYCRLYDQVPSEWMAQLADEGCTYSVEENGGLAEKFTFEWPDQKLVIHVMPRSEISLHLDGFVGYVHWLCGNQGIEPDMDLIGRIRQTQLVLGCVLTPDVVDDGDETESPAEKVMSAIIHHTKSLLFYGDAIYDERLNLILRPSED